MLSHHQRCTTTGRLRLALVIAATSVLLTACGGGRTALAVDEVRWQGDAALVLTTECAVEVEAEVGSDHGGSDLPEVTLWGTPTIGTCRTSVSVPIPADTTRIVDGATSMVLDLPARP